MRQYFAWNLHELFKDYSAHDRLLVDVLFLYKIPLLLVHKLNERNIGTFPNEQIKIVIENQVYELNYLDDNMKSFLVNLIIEAPGDTPLFTDHFGKRISIKALKEFYRRIEYILNKDDGP